VQGRRDSDDGRADKDVTVFLAELGKKLAERWVSLLVVPGLLFVAAATTAAILGQSKSIDITTLRAWLDGLAANSHPERPGVIILLATSILLAAVASALAANLISSLIMRIWTTTASRGLAGLAITYRQRRWRSADSHLDEAKRQALRHPDQSAPGVAAARAARDRIGVRAPESPTWIGDRFKAMSHRVHESYDLDLATLWPRLWLVAPDSVRAELGTAQDAYAASGRLAGWGTLYIILGLRWWPALVIGTVICCVCWQRARNSTAVLAQLVESAVDLHVRDLAERLGIDANGRLSREIGPAITELLPKD
jgi:hypothetical protein